MQLPTPERLVPVATAITIVLDGHMPVRNDKPFGSQLTLLTMPYSSWSVARHDKIKPGE